MITYTALQEQAVRIVEHAHLRQVQLFGVEARHLTFGEPGASPELGDMSIRLESTSTGEGGMAYVVVVQTDVVEPSLQSEIPTTRATIEVAYGALFSLAPEAGGATPEEARAFGFTIAVMTVWQYIRAVITNTLHEMNLGSGTLVIPTITQRELAEAAATVVDEPTAADFAAPEAPAESRPPRRRAPRSRKSATDSSSPVEAPPGD